MWEPSLVLQRIRNHAILSWMVSKGEEAKRQTAHMACLYGS